MKRCFDSRWPARLRRSPKNAARAGSNTTTASAAMAPPLVAPNDSTSMPDCQVICAGVGDVAQTRDFVDAIDGAGLARLGERQRRSDHLVRAMTAIAVKRRLQRRGRDLAVAAGQAGKF